MIKTTKDQIVEIIDKFCNIYGVKKEDLSLKNKYKNGKKKKVVNGVNVSTIRMALGYYISNNFPVSITETAALIGYNDHSTISNNNQKIYFYIKNNDQYFMSYYSILSEIGSEYNLIKFTRIGQKAFYV
jgi:chromosomal replication initiation ATPase DnaA